MDSNNNASSSLPKIIGALVAILVCCACVVIIAAGVIYYRTIQTAPVIFQTPIISTESVQTPVPVPTISHTPVDAVAADSVNVLNSTLVPENDPYELACRLRGICNVSKTVPAPAKPFKVSDKQKFWLNNSDTNQNFQIDAILL